MTRPLIIGAIVVALVVGAIVAVAIATAPRGGGASGGFTFGGDTATDGSVASRISLFGSSLTGAAAGIAGAVS